MTRKASGLMFGAKPMRKIVFALLIAVASGCGDPGPRLVPVSGKVTLDGVPLAHKTIQFIPETGTPGSGAGATSSADGAYELIATRGGALVDHKGACPGTYKVVVVEPMFPVIENPKPAPENGEPAPAVGLPAPSQQKGKGQVIPRIYGARETTPLTIIVPEKGGMVAIELKSAGK